MVCLDDTTTNPDDRNPSLNDLAALKNTQEREQASTPAAIVMAEYFTAMPEGSGGMALSVKNIKLHSPSSIIGTPLDPSSRFEYPFPSPQLEYEPHHPVLYTSHSPHTSSLLAGAPSSSRQRQSYIHPNHDVRDVPIPPTLEKRVNIELRFPRPTEGANVLGQAHTSIKRRKDIDDVFKKHEKCPRQNTS